MTAALQGQICNYLQFNNSINYLNITPDSNAPASEVHTITTNGTSDSGMYQFDFKGWVSDTIAYNATTAQTNAALNASDSWFARNNLSCACSAQATGSFTITISAVANSNGNIERLDGDLIRVIPNDMYTGSALVTFVSTRTTIGRRGFTTGTYSITAYAWCFNDAFFCNGSVKPNV